MKGNKYRTLLWSVVGGLFCICFLGFLFITPYISSGNDSDTTTAENSDRNVKFNKEDGYMEDKSSDENKIEVPPEKKEQLLRSLKELDENKNSLINNNPNLLKLNGRYFYLFDDDILLPTDTSTWKQYDIDGASDGSYSKISEFYVDGENPQSWTQKLSVHEVKMQDKDCFIMADKIVNGIIVSVSEQLEANDMNLEKDMLSFNYVKKDTNNTLLYWERKNIADIQAETQFMRLFISEYSQKMYLVTYTLKQDFNAMKNSDITSYLQTIESIQELKKR